MVNGVLYNIHMTRFC